MIVKDNYGNKKKVHIKDVKPIEMDVATAEFFKKEREQCTTRDAKHVMPIKLIPDLEWKLIENIDAMESNSGVTIYCIKETEDKQKDTQVTKTSKPTVDTSPREIRKNTCTIAINTDPTEDSKTDLPEQRIDTVEVTEVDTFEPTLEDTSKESTVSAITERDAECQITHMLPTIYNPIVNKIFSVFRQAKESLDTIPM